MWKTVLEWKFGKYGKSSKLMKSSNTCVDENRVDKEHNVRD